MGYFHDSHPEVTESIATMVGFENLIRIPGKSFFTLTDYDVACMIDAHIHGGSDMFHESALSEFLLVPNRVARLEKIRRRLKGIDEAERMPDEHDGLRTTGGLSALTHFANELRHRS